MQRKQNSESFQLWLRKNALTIWLTKGNIITFVMSPIFNGWWDGCLHIQWTSKEHCSPISARSLPSHSFPNSKERQATLSTISPLGSLYHITNRQHGYSFKKLSIKKKIKNEKSEKHKNICFLNVCCVMML